MTKLGECQQDAHLDNGLAGGLQRPAKIQESHMTVWHIEKIDRHSIAEAAISQHAPIRSDFVSLLVVVDCWRHGMLRTTECCRGIGWTSSKASKTLASCHASGGPARIDKAQKRTFDGIMAVHYCLNHVSLCNS